MCVCVCVSVSAITHKVSNIPNKGNDQRPRMN